MKKSSYPDLDLEEDIEFEKKNWVAERIAWVILTAIVLAALAGFLGRGGVSNAKAGSAQNGLEIEYPKYLRYHTPENIKVLAHNTGKNGTYSLHINNAWLEKVQLEQITPKPDKETATDKGIIYWFNVSEGSSPLVFTFYFKPEKVGSTGVAITDASGNSVTASQFIYP